MKRTREWATAQGLDRLVSSRVHQGLSDHPTHSAWPWLGQGDPRLAVGFRIQVPDSQGSNQSGGTRASSPAVDLRVAARGLLEAPSEEAPSEEEPAMLPATVSSPYQ